MNKQNIILSPLDQFEIRDLLSLDISLFNNLHFSLTNLGLYLIISMFLIISYSLLAINNNKIIPNVWSISQETLYSTIYSIVINQINPNKGQIYFPFIYTLFIFILVNNLIGMVKRSLTYFFSKFILYIRIYKYIIKFYSTFIFSKPFAVKSKSKYNFNYKNNNNYYLHPYYITGFTDGEGCFSTSIFKDSRTQTGWQIKPIFSISVHNRDRNILESIQRTLSVGKIYKKGPDSIQYRVSSLKNLYVIIEHFNKYPLITQKLADYLLFKKSIDLIKNKEHLTEKGLLKLVSIKASLNLGLSDKFKKSFPNIIPEIKPTIEFTEIKDSNWLRGFIEAEGCFQVIIQGNSDRKNISLNFSITQHTRDKILLKSLINYLGCGRNYESKNRNEAYYIITTFSDIIKNILPFFEKYPLIGCKKKDYMDFVKVAKLIESKNHLTNEGLEKILKIKSNMNTKRIFDSN
jgi:hypothetical protein